MAFEGTSASTTLLAARKQHVLPRIVIIDYCGVAAEPASRLRHQSDHLTAERARFSQAHELAHHVLGQLEGNTVTIPTGAGKTETLFEQLVSLLGANAVVSDFGVASLASGESEFAFCWRQQDAGLPAWHTGVLSKFGLSDWPTPDPGSPAATGLVLRTRPDGPMALPFDGARIAYLKRLVKLLADIAAAAIRQIDGALSDISRELARRMTALARNLRDVVRSFVLIILAACRRYGRRSEQGDHATLPVRRYLMARGAAACA